MQPEPTLDLPRARRLGIAATAKQILSGSARQVAEIQNALDIDVKYLDRNGAPAIFGVTSNFLDLRGDELAAGDFIATENVGALARVAVLGAKARKQFFSETDPIGSGCGMFLAFFVLSMVDRLIQQPFLFSFKLAFAEIAAMIVLYSTFASSVRAIRIEPQVAHKPTDFRDWNQEG